MLQHRMERCLRKLIVLLNAEKAKLISVILVLFAYNMKTPNRNESNMSVCLS